MAQQTQNKSIYTISQRVGTTSISGAPLLPVPARIVTSSNTTGSAANTLTDTAGQFVTRGVRPGDVIMITNNVGGFQGRCMFVATVVDNNNLTYTGTAGLFTTSTTTYTIHPQTDSGVVAAYNSAILINTTTSSIPGISVVTTNGEVLALSLGALNTLPIQVSSVTANGGTFGNLVAVW